MRVTVYKPHNELAPDSWLVNFLGHVYEMNSAADQPNGLCSYLGEEYELRILQECREVSGPDEVPPHVLNQIINLLLKEVEALSWE